MNLVDPSITRYVLSGKVWRVGTGEIEDQTGNRVGSVKLKTLPMRSEIQLANPDGSVLCTLCRKSVDPGPIYYIRDSAGDPLGRAERVAHKSQGAMRMCGNDQEELFKATASRVRWGFVISNSKEKNRVCATVRRVGNWERMALSSPEFGERYTIDVEDSETDRLLLLAYAMVISDVNHHT